MNWKFIIFLVFLALIFMAGASAGDVNQTDSDLNFNKSDSECSFVIQEEDETVFAFRQDSSLNQGVVIRNDTLQDREVIIQEIDTCDNHFIHAIITEDGWVVSHGGDSSNLTATIDLENIAFDMLLTRDISQARLGQIRDTFKENGCYGHFLIKAPDGRYGVAWGETCILGTLSPGEFLVIPNVYEGFRKGNYSGYGISPVDAVIEISSYENSGWSRRNIYTYDYKAHSTANGKRYGVDIYVTNDNGYNVGLDTSQCVSDFYYNDKYYSGQVIAQNPGRLYVADHIFEKQSIDSVVEIVKGANMVAVGDNSVIQYRINDVFDERTAVFDFDGENVEFVNAVVFQGNYIYDSTQQKLYWNLPATSGSKEITLNVRAKSKGVYKIRTHVEGIDFEAVLTTYATNRGVVLTSNNLTAYKGYYADLEVHLSDEEGVPLIGENVSVAVNGITYLREVTSKGYATLAVMLAPGEYDAVISYDGAFGKSQITSKIIVKKTLYSEDLVVLYGNASTFDVYCLDENGGALVNSAVDFSVDGVLKSCLSNSEGIASVWIGDLEVGSHLITSYNLRTNEFKTNLISVVGPDYSTKLLVGAVVATYNVKRNLVITLTDSKSNPISGALISVDLNGVKSFKTDEKGQVKVNLAGLSPKTYTARIKFAGNAGYWASSADVGVTVKKASLKLKAKDKTFKSSGSVKKYSVVVKDNLGRAVKNVKLNIKVNGKKYVAKTNFRGKATFKIKLTKKGSYKSTVTFKGDKCYNKAVKKVKIRVK